jgi:hypothetical protein
MTRRRPRLGLLFLPFMLALYGCASIQQEQVQDTEQLMAAAGFKIQPADTPAKMAHLNSLQPYKLIARSKGDEYVYTYADPQYCKCLYAGGPKAFQELQRLKLQRQQAANNLLTVEEASMNWDLWGPPWW